MFRFRDAMSGLGMIPGFRDAPHTRTEWTSAGGVCVKSENTRMRKSACWGWCKTQQKKNDVSSGDLLPLVSMVWLLQLSACDGPA